MRGSTAMTDQSPNTPTEGLSEAPPRSVFTTRPISHEEAREVAGRLINSHFRQEPRARVGIPARPDYDDDLLILAYIKQQSARSEPRPPTDLAGVRAALEGLLDALDVREVEGRGRSWGLTAAIAPAYDNARAALEALTPNIYSAIKASTRPAP